jgi:hypothetical protein
VVVDVAAAAASSSTPAAGLYTHPQPQPVLTAVAPPPLGSAPSADAAISSGKGEGSGTAPGVEPQPPSAHSAPSRLLWKRAGMLISQANAAARELGAPPAGLLALCAWSWHPLVHHTVTVGGMATPAVLSMPSRLWHASHTLHAPKHAVGNAVPRSDS